MLVSRERERSELVRLVSGIRSGRSGALVVRGPAGIGKTALLDAVLRDAGRGIRVLRAAGVVEEAGLPYAALHQALRPLLPDMTELPEPQAAALRSAFGYDRGPADRFLVALGTLTLLANAAARTPLLLVVEDAHWLADASADTLTFAARRLSEVQSVGMLFAVRDGTAAFPAPQIAEMRLGPLDAAAARELLRVSAPSAAESVRTRLMSEARGNPLALVELPAALDRRQLDGTAPLPRMLPLRESLLCAFLPDAARLSWYLLLAATDHEGDLPTILRAGGDHDDATAALGPAATAGIVELDRQRVRFRHPLVRSAVYQNATMSERRAAHLSLARAAESGTARQIRHLADATLGTDQAVAEALAALAWEAATDAAAAAGLLRRAAELAATPELRLRCLTDAAASAWAASGMEQAGAPALVEQADALAHSAQDRSRLDYLRALMRDGARPAAAALWQSMATSADVMRDTAPWLSARMTALAARSSWDAGQIRGLPLSVARAVGSAPTPEDAPAPWRWLPGPRPHLMGLTTPDVQYHRRQVELLEGGGALASLPGALYELAAAELLTGEWSQAHLHCAQGLVQCEQAGQPSVAGGLHALLAWIAAVRGDAAAHRDHVAAALADGGAAPLTSTRAVTQWARGLGALAESRAQDALHHFLDVVTPGSPAAHDAIALLVYPDLIEVALRTGHRKQARESLARYEAAAGAADGDLCIAGLARATALLADGDDEPAYEKALAATGRAPFEQGRVRLLYGNWLRRQRRVIQAREQLRLGAIQLDSLGADPWAQRARSELRAAGVRERGAEPREPLRPGTALTPQELQIATYAARGLRNSEIAAELYLSPRTVSYHLHKVFPKLGVTSRHQLHELLPLS